MWENTSTIKRNIIVDDIKWENNRKPGNKSIKISWFEIISQKGVESLNRILVAPQYHLLVVIKQNNSIDSFWEKTLYREETDVTQTKTRE